MIAGVSLTEQKELKPGFLLDLYVLKRAYDDEQHGIKRGSDDDHDIGDEEEAAFDEDEDEEET